MSTSATPPKLFSEAFLADPHPTYAYLRRTSPVHRVHLPQGFDLWLLTRYEHVRSVLTDSRFSRDMHLAPPAAQTFTGGPDSVANQNLLTLDPPDHTRVRKLVQKAFTHRRVKELAHRTQEIVDALLAEIAGQESVDLIASFAYPLPITMICELLGVPYADRDDFRRWTDGLVMYSGPDSVQRLRQAQADLLEYFEALIRDKRKQPGVDLISGLVTARDNEQRLSEDELIGLALMLLVAGHETTVNLIATGVFLLLTNPDQRRLLERDWSLLPQAIDEVLRLEGPAGIAFMVTTEQVRLGGTVIPSGQVVAAIWPAANRDPDRFPNPDHFDIARTDNPHFGFGYGIHRCVGAPLATMEASTAISTLLRRFPAISLAAEPAEVKWRAAPFFRGLVELPVRPGAPVEPSRFLHKV